MNPASATEAGTRMASKARNTVMAVFFPLRLVLDRYWHRRVRRLVSACQLDCGCGVWDRAQSRNFPVPLFVVRGPAGRQLRVRVRAVVAETAGGGGGKRQLDPAVA